MSNKILIIEDDAAIAQVLRLNLECADYTVTAFDNGLAAWNALEASHDYDLALLDMMLHRVVLFYAWFKFRHCNRCLFFRNHKDKTIFKKFQTKMSQNTGTVWHGTIIIICKIAQMIYRHA